MKIFLLFLFTTVVVTAAPHASASNEVKLQCLILEQIIRSIKDTKDGITAELFVQNVITPDHCTLKKFCKAGNVLAAYKAEELGLKEQDWLLPRHLVAYSRDITCEDPVSEERVKLHTLLDNIAQCAWKEYTKPW